MTDKKLVFLVDDETEILKSLRRTLQTLNIIIEVFTSPSDALKQAQNNAPDIVISDQRMPFMTGLDFLSKLSQSTPSCSRVLLSGFQDFDAVIKGFNDGAIQYFLSKPWNNQEIKSLVQSLIPNERVSTRDNDDSPFIGEHPTMLQLKSDISRVAGANVPIFILGETGTGKELVAKSCHSNSTRVNKPYIAFNCANLSETLLESQLFGHKKGAFTGADRDFIGLFEQAGQGSVFLDEVTTLPLPIQAKLLRVIQEREFTPLGSQKVLSLEAQVISASSTPLQEAVDNGDFRADLYYRLGVIKLSIPPLKNRENDILLLANYFLKKFNEQHNKNFLGFQESSNELLLSYFWPGNVRQLENIIHQLVILNNDEKYVTSKMLSSCLESNDKAPENRLANHEGEVTTNLSLEEIERKAIEGALKNHQGNVTLAAADLEVNPSTIYRKMNKWK